MKRLKIIEQPRRILLIDDHQNYAERVKSLLENKGYNVDCLNNGLKSIDQLCEVEYDAVIIDMGEASIGTESYVIPDLIKEQFPCLPVIGQTSERHYSVSIDELKKHFDKFYCKYDEHLLPERLDKILNSPS